MSLTGTDPGTIVTGITTVVKAVEGVSAKSPQFLADVRTDADLDRVPATVLFTDIVDSTAQGAALGDRAWGVRARSTTRSFGQTLPAARPAGGRVHGPRCPAPARAVK
jgi:hypothetical protein